MKIGRRLLGLVAGPAMLIALSFVFGGQVFGSYVLFFGGIGAVIFASLFMVGLLLLKIDSLIGFLILGSAIPAVSFGLLCIGQACPNFTVAGAAPWFAAANFCAFIFWLITRQWP